MRTHLRGFTSGAMRAWGISMATACLFSFGLALAPSAASAKPPKCVGSGESPGVLSGTYSSSVVIEGPCYVNAGPAVVRGNVIVRSGGVLAAIFAYNDATGSGRSSLKVYGNVIVEPGGGAYIGCEPEYFACRDDPEGTAYGHSSIYGNVRAKEALGVIMHDTMVQGNIIERGGGGGDTPDSCEPGNPSFPFGYYSDYEDLDVHGNIYITGVESCWLGLARDHVVGNVRLKSDQLADPDAIEVLANNIEGNLACRENSRLWDNAETGEEGIFPREPEPNKVGGRRVGQCVYSSPETQEALEKGELGTEPF